MEERSNKNAQTRLPGEVVEVYYRPNPKEVVEVYTRPWPNGSTGAERQPKPARKRHKKGLWIFMGCFCTLVVLAVAAVALYYLRPTVHVDFHNGSYEFAWEAEESGEITAPTWPTGQGVQLPIRWEFDGVLTPQEIYRQVNPSVVTVLTERNGGTYVGTGVVFTEDGYILTNYHLAEGASAFTVAFHTGYQQEAFYVAGQAACDLAILKVDAEGLTPAEFGDSDRLVVGDSVYAIGNPLGYDFLGTMTDGIVSAVNREVLVDDEHPLTVIQTNAALNQGNSGGPLINQYGQVVGINFMKLDSSYSTIEGLGFAIPTALMERVVNDLLTYGEVLPRPLLGISVELLATQVEENLFGLKVVEVVPGAAGDRAGVQPGDILLSADGKALSVSQDLLRMRDRHYVGEEMQLVFWRDGEQQEVTLQLLESVETE